MSKTMEAIAAHELLNKYVIDDYLNVYRKDTGYLLDENGFITLKTKVNFTNTGQNGVWHTSRWTTHNLSGSSWTRLKGLNKVWSHKNKQDQHWYLYKKPSKDRLKTTSSEQIILR